VTGLPVTVKTPPQGRMAVGADRPAVGRRFKPWLPVSQRTLWVPVTVLAGWATVGVSATGWVVSLVAWEAAVSSLRVPSLEVELGSIGDRQRRTETSTSRIKPPRRASAIRGGGEELEERPDIVVKRDLVGVFPNYRALKSDRVVDGGKVCDRLFGGWGTKSRN
jgi:hypothetical protein